MRSAYSLIPLFILPFILFSGCSQKSDETEELKRRIRGLEQKLAEVKQEAGDKREVKKPERFVPRPAPELGEDFEASSEYSRQAPTPDGRRYDPLSELRGFDINWDQWWPGAFTEVGGPWKIFGDSLENIAYFDGGADLKTVDVNENRKLIVYLIRASLRSLSGNPRHDFFAFPQLSDSKTKKALDWYIAVDGTNYGRELYEEYNMVELKPNSDGIPSDIRALPVSSSVSVTWPFVVGMESRQPGGWYVESFFDGPVSLNIFNESYEIGNINLGPAWRGEKGERKREEEVRETSGNAKPEDPKELFGRVVAFLDDTERRLWGDSFSADLKSYSKIGDGAFKFRYEFPDRGGSISFDSCTAFFGNNKIDSLRVERDLHGPSSFIIMCKDSIREYDSKRNLKRVYRVPK